MEDLEATLAYYEFSLQVALATAGAITAIASYLWRGATTTRGRVVAAGVYASTGFPLALFFCALLGSIQRYDKESWWVSQSTNLITHIDGLMVASATAGAVALMLLAWMSAATGHSEMLSRLIQSLGTRLDLDTRIRRAVDEAMKAQRKLPDPAAMPDLPPPSGGDSQPQRKPQRKRRRRRTRENSPEGQ